jgi:ferritin
MDVNVIEDALRAKKKKEYISPKISSLMNDLIAAEFNASQLYKSMATWCEYVGYEGSAKYFNKHTDEERKHMNKLYEYSLDRQCNPVTPAVKAQPISYKDLKDVLEQALSHEELIENTYKKAIKVAWDDNDTTTFTLFQWFLNEQVEEIKVFAGLLDRLEVIGYDKKGMFFLDKEIDKLI